MEQPIVNARLTVTWSEPWDEARAQRLIELHDEERQLGLMKSGDDLASTIPKESGTICRFAPALRPDGDSRLAMLEAGISANAALRFRLRILPRPEDSSPPEGLIRINDTLGHRERIARLVSSERKNYAPIALHVMQMYLPRQGFACHLVPRNATDSETRLSDGLGRARCEQIGFRFDSGASGLEEVAIIYLHEEERFNLTATARGALQIGQTRWLPFCDMVARLPFSRYFEEL